ncbi:MAG: glycosyltransferase, partial [Armatimonadota bacterium]
MRCLVVTHKALRRVAGSPIAYATDGGFPRQMEALSYLFDSLVVAAPVYNAKSTGDALLVGQNLSVRPLGSLPSVLILRRLALVWWLLIHLPRLLIEVWRADVVHTPIPGDVGTIGMVLAWLLRKCLLVRHCGNWARTKTLAEHLWRWFIEANAGGRRVMIVTGLSERAPSWNRNVRWCFATSLWEREIAGLEVADRRAPTEGRLCIATACRQVKGKGVEALIESVVFLRKDFPEVRVNVFGDGPERDAFQRLAQELGVGSHVHFYGQIAQKDLWARFREADVFCL